jgi:hypothetical protein
VFKPSAIAHTTAVHDRERKGDSTDAHQRTPGVPHRPMAVLGMVLGVAASLELLAVANSGMTVQAYDQTIRDWLATTTHPTFQRPYTELVYVPMQELLAYLREHEFNMTSLWTEGMNGLDEIGVARESLQCGLLILPEESSDVVLLRLQAGRVEPRHILLEVAPDPFNGVERGAIGWQEHEVHVVRQGEPWGPMGPPIVQQEDIQAVSEGLGEGIDEELEHVRIQIWQFQEEALARRRLHSAIDAGPCEDMRHRANRLDATRSETPRADGQEAETAFILAKDPDGAGVRSGDRPLKLCLTGGLEHGDGLRRCLWSWGAALCASP